MLTEATIYNLHDLFEERLGHLTADKVRKITVSNALVDSGATTLCLTTGMIQQLGLVKQAEKRTITAAWFVTVKLMY